jgi:gamma-glutamyltranspeptidase/glutathione hydrolase
MSRSLPLTGLLAALLFAAAACTTPAAPDGRAAAVPAAPTGMVVTANPLATQAGVNVLERGGSAVDAAVAIEAVLSLVEPQSSGLGGGGFMVTYSADSGALTVYDGRETAPAGATPELFIAPDGEPYGYLDAKNSGLAIGVPGVVAALSLAHGDQGVLPWSMLFTDAIRLAEAGFPVSPRLHGMLQAFGKYLPDEPAEGPTDAYDYFFGDDGEPVAIGELLHNPAYAETLRLLATDARALYRGELAAAIAAAAQEPPRAGTLTVDDIAAYEARRVEALCSPWGEFQLCGPPPPSSWVAVAMTMGLLERTPAFGRDRMTDWVLFGEAQRLAYADRDRFVADDDFVPVPLTGLLNPEYLAQRARQIDPAAAEATVQPGDPWAFQAEVGWAPGIDGADDTPGTTHFVVMDGSGNVVSMTASVESIFGSTRMAGGMFLNNQLTDFARQPNDADGNRLANAPAPGKRPRSSMSPTIVLDRDGTFRMATGSPGGNSIIAYTLKTLVGVLSWGLDPQAAVALPNLVARGDLVRIEAERASPELLTALRNYGFEVRESQGENSGLSVIVRFADGSLVGGVDPRREGTIGIPEGAGRAP